MERVTGMRQKRTLFTAVGTHEHHRSVGALPLQFIRYGNRRHDVTETAPAGKENGKSHTLAKLTMNETFQERAFRVPYTPTNGDVLLRGVHRNIQKNADAGKSGEQG